MQALLYGVDLVSVCKTHWWARLRNIWARFRGPCLCQLDLHTSAKGPINSPNLTSVERLKNCKKCLNMLASTGTLFVTFSTKVLKQKCQLALQRSVPFYKSKFSDVIASLDFTLVSESVSQFRI